MSYEPGEWTAKTLDDGGPLETSLVQETAMVAHRPAVQGKERRRSVVLTFAVGETVAERFRIVRWLGQGGMGQVFEAEDLELGERVALKIVRPEIARRPGVLERFKREVMLAKKVTHNNVCRIFDLFQHQGSGDDGWGRSEGLFFLTMELLSGETLSHRLRRGPLEPAAAITVAEQIGAALAAAHRAGVVHRDLKSGNVMLVPSSEGPRAVVTDFGLARVLHPPSPEGEPRPDSLPPGSGTPGYMAPEILDGTPASPASDLYSLGVVVHEMLTTALPSPLDAYQRRLPHPRWRRLPRRFTRALLRCLDPEPERRFDEPGKFLAALRPWYRSPGRYGWLMAALMAVTLTAQWSTPASFRGTPVKSTPAHRDSASTEALLELVARSGIWLRGALGGRGESATGALPANLEAACLSDKNDFDKAREPILESLAMALEIGSHYGELEITHAPSRLAFERLEALANEAEAAGCKLLSEAKETS